MHKLLALALLAIPVLSAGGEARFYRGYNLGGGAVIIDGHRWEGDAASSLEIRANSFENQNVPLRPPTDPERARMIRSSRWGGGMEVRIKEVPDGIYQVCLYVWEDNNSERFDIFLNGAPVEKDFHSGPAGTWKKLGPWKTTPENGELKITAKGGAANLSGIEIWSGEGTVPMNGRPEFITDLTEAQREFFEKRVRPVLVENCYECHSLEAESLKGGLLLDSRAGIMKGGDDGPVIYPGFPDASLLIQAVRRSKPDLEMPPENSLSEREIAALEEWVRMGAPDPRDENTVAMLEAKTAIDWKQAREWWSFQPLADEPPPEVRRKEWPRNDLDRFILARLEKEGLPPAKDASRRVLIRRVSFDLTGLPPAPEEIEAFVNDPSPDAFTKLVDRLLESPAYGERWGRHWLDVVRYADTAGDNSDFPIPQLHLYRNWVIEAFNRDLPYDDLIRMQLAGDLLPSQSKEEKHEGIIATGYIANARRFGSRVADYPWHLTIEDTIDNLGRAFLGLTVSCARCHDHKFDPIPTADYYALYGIFNSTRYPWPGIELDQQQRDLVPLVSEAEAEAGRKAHAEKQRELDEEAKRLEDRVKMAEGEPKKELEKKRDEAKRAADKHRKSPPPFPRAYAVAEAEKIGDAAIQLKGDPAKPGEIVPRRFLTVLGGAELKNPSASGRLELANWIADPENPLTARVMVNRIWNYHFGNGIVPTPNDFGRQGKPPSHPELLDWLAARFIDSGWSVKSMHRLILRSRTYQLSSGLSPEAAALDPENRLLSAFPRRRLDAESIRDSLLAVAGMLDRSQGGAHPFPPQHEWGFTQHNPFKAVYPTHKRSIYLMIQRIQRHPFLAIFDGADPAASTARRLTSTTPLQALFLLNDPFLHEQSEGFAARLLKVSADPNERLRRAYLLALGREPDLAEMQHGRSFLAAVSRELAENGAGPERAEAGAWQAMARVLFRLNEFIYID